MPQFRYTARDSSGQLVDGIVTANDRGAAIAQVEQKKCTPIKIAPADGAAPAESPVKALPANGGDRGGEKTLAKAEPKQVAAKTSASTSKNGTAKSSASPALSVATISYSQQYLFCEQLAHLLSAGMTLDESLGVLVKRLKQPKLRALSQSLHQSLLDGRSLSQAMKDFPKIFNSLFVNMISAGEASGSLALILRRLTAYLAEVKSLRDRVQQALMYPAFLVVAGIGLVLVFMTTMVPQLTSFFKDTGSKLPAVTKMLIDANDIITGYWWAILGGIIGAVVLFKAAVASPSGKLAWHKFKWSVPVFSLIPRYRFYAQFARTLGTLTSNGVTLLRALELLEDVADNEFVRLRMVEIRAAVVDGATLSGASAPQKVFPEMFVDMMGVGEQTGKFPDTMNLIADVYERELDKQVEVVSALIPPMVMVAIAAVIGVVIYGILVAVFNLTSGVRTH
jgi:type II secretory pathway component PulF